MFDFSQTFHGVNNHVFFQISPTLAHSDFLLKRAVRAVQLVLYLDYNYNAILKNKETNNGITDT